MQNNSLYVNLMEQSPLGWSFDGHENFNSFEFEKIDLFYWHDFISKYWDLPYYAGAVYIATIFGLQKYLRNKPALQLNGPLFWWNLSLGVFSIVGFLRVLPGFIFTIQQPNGLYSSICLKRYLNIPTMYWWFLFIFSKFLELGDTVFIVLRKRPLIFLQWYHHLITLIVVWTVTPYGEPVTRWYTVLNYGVHALMYPYFACRAKGIRVPSRVANLITTLQFLQMIIGFAVNLISVYFYHYGHDCMRHPLSIQAFCLVYGSFLILFGKLFHDMVLQSGRDKKEKLH